MSVSDPIGDLLARIRNGQMRRKDAITAPASRVHKAVLDVFKEEGFIRGYTEQEVRKGVSELSIELKYHEGRPAIKEMTRISKPGRRVYSAVNDLQPVFNGLGVAVISTSMGIMSDKKAREQQVGGEVLCTLF